MFRRLISKGMARSQSAESTETGSSHASNSIPALASPRIPPPTAFLVGTDRTLSTDSDASYTVMVRELAAFDASVEASDALAASSTSSGRTDKSTGLVDCSVLVSADGDLLIIPQEQQATANTSENESDKMLRRTPSMVKRTVSELFLGEEYESAVFMGNDLHVQGDKALNGFSAKGWSIPATSLALKQTEDCMGDLADFVEDMVLVKKDSAARQSQVVDRLRVIAEAPERGKTRATSYQKWVQQTFPDRSLDIVPTRVGPLASPGGTIQATVVALESYYSDMAEYDANKWREATQQVGFLTRLQSSKEAAGRRASNRLKALQKMFEKAKNMEERLAACKEEATRRWDAVHDAEVTVTRLVEEKMIERSRLREQQRLEQLKKEEELRARNSANGNFGATSSEIWDIVSAVAASMEEGSFEPMDLPTAPLSVPMDQSKRNGSTDIVTPSPFEEDQQWQMPILQRHDLEEECGLPDLRLAAMAADEAVEDASNNLLSVLSNFDTINRSARIAAETCLVSACSAQAACLQSLIRMEREAIEERMKRLKDLEEVAEHIDVRADLNHYITLDKKLQGGRSMLGDDDDGGVASALGVLSSHIDGNTGMGSAGNFKSDGQLSSNDDDTTSPEILEGAMEIFFESNPRLHPDAPNDEETARARAEFEETVSLLCRAAGDPSSANRSRRSTMCYALNSKRSVQVEICSDLQFDGLCRVFIAILNGCDTESSGVSLAKMCMMLSQTFYKVAKDSKDSGDSSRNGRIFVKSRLDGHPLWDQDDFW